MKTRDSEIGRAAQTYGVMDFPLLEGYRTTSQAAVILQVTNRQVRYWISDGRFDGVKKIVNWHTEPGGQKNEEGKPKPVQIILIPVEEVAKMKHSREINELKKTLGLPKPRHLAEIMHQEDRLGELSLMIAMRRKAALANKDLTAKQRKSPNRDAWYKQYGKAFNKIYDQKHFYTGRKRYIEEYRNEGKYFELTRARDKDKDVTERFRMRKFVENAIRHQHRGCGGWIKIVPDTTLLWSLECNKCHGYVGLPKAAMEELSLFSYAHVLKLNKDVTDMLKEGELHGN